MPDLFEISAPELNRAVYVAIASVKQDPRLDILAGVTYYMLLQRPGLSAARIREKMAALDEMIAASSPDQQFDQSLDSSIYMSRILARLMPGVTDPVLRAGAKDYTLAFYNSFRSGLDLFRQVAPLDTQIDRHGEVDRFRRDTWDKLHEFATQRPRLAKAIDESLIAQALGVKTTQNAPALLEAVPIQGLVGFVSGHIQPDGSLSSGLADLETGIAAVTASATGLGSAYAANLFDLDDVEQAFRDVLSIFCPKDEKEEKKTELEKAIEKAKEKQKELDGVLGDVRAGVQGTLDVFAFLISGDKELAADVKKLTEVTVALLDGLQVLKTRSRGENRPAGSNWRKRFCSYQCDRVRRWPDRHRHKDLRDPE
jgi:hypothetical protein